MPARGVKGVGRASSCDGGTCAVGAWSGEGVALTRSLGKASCGKCHLGLGTGTPIEKGVTPVTWVLGRFMSNIQGHFYSMVSRYFFGVHPTSMRTQRSTPLLWLAIETYFPQKTEAEFPKVSGLRGSLFAQ